jgi:DNA-3-methyladenine glycosylase I
LKKRGWRFVGPTTVYAFMQAMGLVNDHIDGCAIRPAVEEARRARRL